MMTKHLHGDYPGGYTLSAGYNKLVIGKGAEVGGLGVDAPDFATVVNRGTVQGVYLHAGGSVINGSTRNTSALIGGIGVDAYDASAVANFGTLAGVFLRAGGSVTNGSTDDTVALIDGFDGVDADAAASVVNFGTIAGYVGVLASGAAATISNFGTIRGEGDYAVGVRLLAGGSLTNGSIHDTTALIDGSYGVEADGAVVNFGTIRDGVFIYGGSITNGSSADSGAYISYVYGRFAAASIANFGVIGTPAVDTTGVFLKAGGQITNGSAGDTAALITGVRASLAATIVNFGTLYSSDQFAGPFDAGVRLEAGGSVTNGSESALTALITGDYGIYVSSGAANVVNFGTIGGEGYSSAGVRLSTGGSLTNGSSDDSAALIYGPYGVEAYGSTVVNFGTIEGTRGISVYSYGAGSEVIAEAGSTFLGEIEGGGGRLALAGGGSGTISNLGRGGTLTGAVEADFIHFRSVVIEAGGTWTLAVSNEVDTTDVLADQGTLINDGALTVAGTLSIEASAVFELASGNISAGPTGVGEIVDDGLMMGDADASTIVVGAHMDDNGVVEVAAGALDFTSHLLGTGVLQIDGGATLEADAAAVSTLSTVFNGQAATLALKIPDAFHATLAGLATSDTIDLLGQIATGASVNSNDQLVVVDGSRTVATLQLRGNYVGATFTTQADGRGGTDVTLVSAPDAGLPSVRTMTAAMAGLMAPAGVAAVGRGFPEQVTLNLANPHIHLQ